MDLQKLEEALDNIVRKKNALAETDYNDETYDDLEEELHDLEDDLVEEYGAYLEEILSIVHDEYCPDTDVLSPIAYLANRYVEIDGGWNCAVTEGVLVEADDFPNKAVRMVIAPKPLRVFLNIGNTERIVAWKQEEAK